MNDDMRILSSCFLVGLFFLLHIAYLEKVEVDLFGISVLFFVHRHKKVLHIHDHPQQSINLILRNIFQVGHMISCKQRIEHTNTQLRGLVKQHYEIRSH